MVVVGEGGIYSEIEGIVDVLSSRVCHIPCETRFRCILTLQVASSLDSTIFKFSYSKKEKYDVLNTWDSNLQHSDPESMGESCHPQGANTGGDLLDDLATDPLC